jgi:NapH/MauN family ferredoxin-type protein
MGKYNTWLRRVVQTLFLGLWIYLFWQTAEKDKGPIPPDLFLFTDPLVAFLTMVASTVWVPAMLGGALLIVLTLVFGRFFCGWVCPLGTLFDVVGRIFVGKGEKELSHDEAWRRFKYYLLAGLVLVALVGGQLLYWFDPLVILFRGTTYGEVTHDVTTGSFLPIFFLLALLGLNLVAHRFWCRYLCPLGALYGAFSRFSIFRRRLKGCDKCKADGVQACQQHCAMHVSINRDGRPEECIRCMSCQTVCKKNAVTFAPTTPLPGSREVTVNLERRTLVASLGIGAAAGYAATKAHLGNGDRWRVVRPPMVTDNEVFTALCVRCGQCVRSCPSGTLQPLLLEAGFAGLWTPAVTPTVGGCEDACNNCSKACPTEAIPSFGPLRKEKWALKMGSVAFESMRCISYAPDAVKPCLKCVEACPNKAIVIDESADPIRPILVTYDRCVGCGACENACLEMVTGKPAMILNNNGVGEPTALVVDPTPAIPNKKRDS